MQSSSGPTNARRHWIHTRRNLWKYQSWCTLTLTSDLSSRRIPATKDWEPSSLRSWKTSCFIRCRSEKNYAVTELETLAVVWATKHYRAYLYGHDVQVVTDHSAVKALLSNPSANGKHARWWLHVYGSGLRKVDIVYRPGRENTRADALSRNPTETPDHHPLDVQVEALSSKATDISMLLHTHTWTHTYTQTHTNVYTH